MTGPPLIDRAVIDDLFEHIGVDGTRLVLGLFVGETRTALATIAAAVVPDSDAASRERARRAAHSLKSGAGQIGAAALAALAAAVERAAENGAPELVPAATPLHQCAEDTIAALNEFLAK